MTTNGTLLNDEVNKLIVENKISTIISIDGDKENNDKNEIDNRSIFVTTYLFQPFSK